MHTCRGTSRLLCVALLLASCSGKKVTEIVVSTATDLEVPHELAVIDFKVENTTIPIVEQSWDVDPARPDAIEVPATVGLFPTTDSDRPILITIKGRGADNKQLVERKARLSFARDRVVWLKMNLLRSCLYVDCDNPEETCSEEGCQPVDQKSSDLPDYDRDEALKGLEASTPRRDAGSDGPLDGPALDRGRDHGLRAEHAAPDLNARDDASQDSGVSRDTRPSADAPRDTGHVADAARDQTVVAGDLVLTPGCANGWCVVAPGTFQMGSPATEMCRDSDEQLHQVTINRWLEVGQTEVTQGQFQDVMAYTPFSNWQCDKGSGLCPAENVTWHEAADYCNRLSGTTYTKCFGCTGSGAGRVCNVVTPYANTYVNCPGYRLPTEAEWEYFARAGVQRALYNYGATDIMSLLCTGVDIKATAIAWYDANSVDSIHPVKGKQPNAWQIYDTIGNVAEWTADLFVDSLGSASAIDPWNSPTTATDDDMVVRGGSYSFTLGSIRLANRASQGEWPRMADVGFRCVRSLTNTAP